MASNWWNTNRMSLVTGALVVGLTSCGSDGAESTTLPTTPPSTTEDSTPTTDTTSQGSSSTANNPITTTGSETDWGLPTGPDAPAGPVREHPIYIALSVSDCAQAQSDLDRWWDDMRWPRNVLLYQAGIEICSGNIELGQSLLDQASSTFGWDGLTYDVDGFTYDCNIYQAARGVLEQGEPGSFDCPGGTPVPWPDGAEDDPRTPDDESISTTTTTSEGDTSTTEEAEDTSTTDEAEGASTSTGT